MNSGNTYAMKKFRSNSACPKKKLLLRFGGPPTIGRVAETTFDIRNQLAGDGF